MGSFQKRSLLPALLMTLSVTGCSKTVQWEEEVLLNTGETITVTKHVHYSVKGQPGNPADRSLLPDPVETLTFQYGKRSYTYKGEASVMVLAISPRGMPVLLAPPGSRGWDDHNDYPLCTKPYYVQLEPDASGQTWTWPKAIDRWTHNLPANLMLHRDHPSDVKRRYTMADKAKQAYMQDPQSLYLQRIDPEKSSQNCHTRSK